MQGTLMLAMHTEQSVQQEESMKGNQQKRGLAPREEFLYAPILFIALLGSLGTALPSQITVHFNVDADFRILQQILRVSWIISLGSTVRTIP